MDFFENLFARPIDNSDPIHARLWPGVHRALCHGGPAERLSAEALDDEDADVTCDDCLRVMRDADREWAETCQSAARRGDK